MKRLGTVISHAMHKPEKLDEVVGDLIPDPPDGYDPPEKWWGEPDNTRP